MLDLNQVNERVDRIIRDPAKLKMVRAGCAVFSALCLVCTAVHAFELVAFLVDGFHRLRFLLHQDLDAMDFCMVADLLLAGGVVIALLVTHLSGALLGAILFLRFHPNCKAMQGGS